MDLSLLQTAVSGRDASLIPRISLVDKLTTTTTTQSSCAVQTGKFKSLESHKNQQKEV